MKLLFVHPNMPGQYKHLAPAFAKDPANQVVFLTKPKPKVNLPNVTKVEFDTKRDVQPETHRYLIPFERAVFASQEAWRVCKKIKESGFTPDVIVGHLGFGDGLFLKDIYPDTPILTLLEFFYSARGADVDFLREEAMTPDAEARIRMKNAQHLYNLIDSDWGICPTFFQLKQHPAIFHPKISVLHDGVDTDAAKPRAFNNLTIGNKVVLGSKSEVVTYISRNFEPYRGFPTFMRAAEIILRERPNCHIVMLGADEVSYGQKPKGGKTWRQTMMAEVKLDPVRFHVMGHLPYDEMIKIMQISSAHIYLTVPFVLSWSMLEAMACGCLVVGSRTPPVMEVIEEGRNGLLADFFSPRDVADRVHEVLDHPDRMQKVREAARQTILDKYALKKLLPLHMCLITDLAEKKLPPPTMREIAQLYT